MYLQAVSLVSVIFSQIIDPMPPRPPRHIPTPAPQEVSLQSAKISVRIVDGVATTELEQVFYNPTGSEAEETFVLPIPPETVITELALSLDGKEVRGEVLDQVKARQIYNQIVSSRRDPALLEYAGFGLVRASLFPIPARGQAKMKMKYTSLLRPSGGLYDYNFPLRVAGLATHQLRSVAFDLQIHSSKPIQTIYSPSHKIDIVREGDRIARISSEGGQNLLERDFRLVYGISDSEFGLSFLSYQKANGDSYFLMFLAPKHEIAQNRVQPKDIVFVLDTSGSMAGEKIKQAKEALKFCINRLNPSDRFNIVRFSTESEKFRESLAEANSENVKQALGFVDGFEARGGTNIHEALESALGCRKETEQLFMVCFLTDGLPTIGVTDVDQILGNVRAKNSSSARIFTFGVGDDVNTRLLDTIADETRATRCYVRPNENIEVAVSHFYDQVSVPVLANPSIHAEGMEILENYPKQIPDLFKGTQIVVAGRFRLPRLLCGTPPLPKQTLRLSGNILGEKREWVYQLDLYQEAAFEKNEFIPHVWASRKVGYLLDQIRLHGSNQELIQEVTRLGKEFGILTPYTSHLVVEEQIRVSQNVRRAGEPAPSAPSAGLRAAADDAKKDFERLKEGKGEESGAGAIAKSKMVQSLSNLNAPAQTPSGLRDPLQEFAPKQVGEKLFYRVGEFWVDGSLEPGERETAKKLPFLSEDYFKFLDAEPELRRVFALGSKLVVKWKGVVYEVSMP